MNKSIELQRVTKILKQQDDIRNTITKDAHAYFLKYCFDRVAEKSKKIDYKMFSYYFSIGVNRTRYYYHVGNEFGYSVNSISIKIRHCCVLFLETYDEFVRILNLEHK